MTATAPTQAQLDANRANAQHSTGPKSEEGKAASAQNSRKHGFTSRSFCVEDSEREHFTLFLIALRDELQPSGALEEHHFQIVVQTAWNLQRLGHHESQILSAFGNPFLDERLGKILDRLSRYKRNMERSHSQAFNTLVALQAARAQNEPKSDAEPSILPPIQVHLVTKRTQSGHAGQANRPARDLRAPSNLNFSAPLPHLRPKEG